MQRQIIAIVALFLVTATQANAQQLPPNTLVAPDVSGEFATFSGATSSGQIDFGNPFFQPIGLQFGGNSRTCSSCHIPDNGWSISPQRAQSIFNASNGFDPLFDPVDGANAPNVNRSTLAARRLGSSILLNKGLIRIASPIRPGSNFTLAAVTVPQDGSFPADFAQNALNTQVLSVFRRPPSTANLSFLTDVMWDGRELIAGRSMFDNLVAQSVGAARGHLEANVQNGQLTPQQRQIFQNIVSLELDLFGAQIRDNAAGLLDESNAIGGPLPLFAPPPAFFEGGVFNLFTAWNQLPGTTQLVQARRSVARGEALFNNRVFNTGEVFGQVTCTTCHGVRGAGSSILPRRFNLRLSVPDISFGGERVNAPLPVYTLRRNSDGRMVRTTDPGRILISGIWSAADGDAFKIPILRGLAARAPYFHGGQARTINEVVRFYNGRFGIGLTAQQRLDLENFLRSL